MVFIKRCLRICKGCEEMVFIEGFITYIEVCRDCGYEATLCG